MSIALKKSEDGGLDAGSVRCLHVFDASKKAKFLELISISWPDVSRCAAAVGVTATTFYNHMKSDVKFREAILAIKQSKLDEIEGSVFQAAKSSHNFLHQAMVLKAYRPELYNPARVIRVEGGLQLSGGQAKERQNKLAGAIDAEVIQNYFDRKERKQLKASGVKVQGKAGGGEKAGGGA